MSRRQVLNGVGLALVALSFVIAFGRVVLRTAREVDPDRITLRFSHWQVEAGMREAFDAVADEYTAMHPHVRVEQLPCPGDVYGVFIRTRLVGGDPPELMELGRGQPPEQMARYFRPYGQWLDEPNPYNEGTPLEGVPWRDTFLDGLSNAPGVDTLFEYYAIPISGVSSRMYYNLDLYRRIMSRDRLPENLADLFELCRRTREYAERTGSAIVPVAGSSGTANVMLSPMLKSQTQELAGELDRLHVLRTPPQQELLLEPAADLDRPEIRHGLDLVRNIARYMPRGFMTYNRDDAIFAFGQGRAVSLAAGSWDYVGIRDQVDFPIGLARIPLPTPDNPTWGEGVVGRPAETTAGGAAFFFLTQASRHPEQAVDFLRYLTSVPGQRTFVRVSTWLPAAREVEPHPESAAFFPVVDGYHEGFEISKFRWGGGEVYRIFTNKLHVLFDPDGGVEAFLRELQPQFAEALRTDVERQLKHAWRFSERQDGVLAACRALERTGDAEAARRLSAMFQIQNDQESHSAWMAWKLAKFAAMEGL